MYIGVYISNGYIRQFEKNFYVYMLCTLDFTEYSFINKFFKKDKSKIFLLVFLCSIFCTKHRYTIAVKSDKINSDENKIYALKYEAEAWPDKMLLYL